MATLSPFSREASMGILFTLPAVGPCDKIQHETNSVGGEAVLDFMFWPSAKHRFGWYLEPGYEYNFGRGHEQSLGISGGLLISIL